MHGMMGRTLCAFTLAGLAIAGPLPAEGAQSGAGKRDSSVKFGLRKHFPVQVEGDHYVSNPYGDAEAIAAVAEVVQRQGARSRARIKGLRITEGGGSRRRALERYDYTFPKTCGGHQFSYFAGATFTALGFHYQDKIVLDVLSGAGGFTAPRLWGPNDQVLYEAVPMQFVAGDARTDGIGLLRTTYVVGYLAALPAAKREEYGQAYAVAVNTAQACS